MAEITHKLVFAPLYPEGANKIVSLSVSGSVGDIDVAAIAERAGVNSDTHDVDRWYILAPSDARPDTYWYKVRAGGVVNDKEAE